MSYFPSLPNHATFPTSILLPFLRKAPLQPTSSPDRSTANFLPPVGRSLGAGSPCTGAAFFLMFALMFLIASPEAFASLATPFTAKLTTLSSQLEIIGKSVVGVSVLIGIILSATGHPQWKMIITSVCVGVAILGFTAIKGFIGL